MTAQDWADVIHGDNDGSLDTLYALCDWLEERGEGADAAAGRLLPGFAREVSRQRLAPHDGGPPDSLTLRGDRGEWYVWNYPGSAGDYSPEHKSTVAGRLAEWAYCGAHSEGGHAAALARWWEAHTGYRLVTTWRAGGRCVCYFLALDTPAWVKDPED